MDGSKQGKMADGLRRAEFKGAWLGLEVLDWLDTLEGDWLRDAFSARKGGAGQPRMRWPRRRWPEDRWLER